MARKPDPKTSLNAVLAIGGMTCEHCERRVREALEAVPGVAASRVSLADGSAVVRLAAPVASLALAERHRNAHDGVMGGAIFTLADFAFAALTNGPGRSTVAQQVSVSFLAAPKVSRLVATARWRKDGRSSCVVNVDVADDTGRDIAQFVGTGFKLPAP